MRKLTLALLALLLTLSLSARERIDGFVEYGGQKPSIAGSARLSTAVQGSYPGATVTVYEAGTLTIATIYSTSGGAALANPFTALSNGYWYFYADDGCYDIRFSGGGLPASYTRSDICTRYAASTTWINAIESGYGVTCDGTTDDTAAFEALFTAAAVAGKDVYIPAGKTCNTTSTLDITTKVRILGWGAKILKGHDSLGVEIQPTPTALGDTLATGAVNTVQISGAAWTADEHVGEWVEIPTPRPQSRRITSNTSDTLTLEHDLAVIPIIVTLTSSGTTATATVDDPGASEHGFITGNSVTISGANEANYNGTFSITKTSDTTFTYTMSGTATSPATGDIIATKSADLNAGIAVELYDPIEYVDIHGLTLDGTGSAGGGGMAIRYADEVTLTEADISNNYRTNCTIQTSKDVRVYGGHFNDSQAAIGLLVINSDNVKTFGITANRNGVTTGLGTYGHQFKDCRDAEMIGATAVGNSKVGLNIKSAGINKTYNCAIRGGIARDNGSYNYKAHALGNEGRTYNAERYSITDAVASEGHGGIWTYEEAGMTMDCDVRGGIVENLEGTGIGLVVQAAGNRVSDVTIRNGNIRGAQVDADNVIVERIRLSNNNLSGSNSEEIQVAGASGAVIRDIEIIHDNASSKSVRGIRELAGSTNNFYGPFKITETTGSFTDAVLLGTGSFFLGHSPGTTGTFATVINDSITAATTITPYAPLHRIIGTTNIETVTVPTGWPNGGQLHLYPLSAFTWSDVGIGSILVPSGSGTAVVGKLLTLTWSADSNRWVPSY